MLSNAQEFNSIGGGPGIGYGGFGYGGFPAYGGGWGGIGGLGAIGLFGLIGLDSFRGRGGHGGGHGHDRCCDDQNELATLAAIAGVKDTTVGEGRGILAAIANAKDTTVGEGRGLLAAVAANREASAAQAFALSTLANQNTQSIKDQLTAQAIVNDSRFDALTLAGVNQTAAILARINQVELDELRDQLHCARRVADVQETKISIQNTNQQVQQQLQEQKQWQTERDFDHIRRFDALFNSFNKIEKNSQDVINLGTMLASGNQANQQTQVK